MTDKEIKTLEQSAQKGDKKAAAQLNELGVDYQFGNNGQKVDLAQALHYYTIAAEGGNTNAMCNAAYCYATGAAGKVDAEKAFGLYQKAAEAGDLNGMTNLAGCYLNGFGTKQDAVEAIKWLVETLNAGAKNLQETLEQVFASLSPEDIKKFKQSGYSAAQYQMAEYCLKSRKSKDAILWYVQSYKSGNADAVTRMMTLAEDFRHGKNGQKEDLPFAYQLYVNAAECGNIEARTKVAYCLYNGIGVEKDTKRAFVLYEQLAKEGNEKGMANLGLIYCKGEGVQKDIQKAIYWSTRAAEELDSVNAMNTLTHIYAEEDGYINHGQAAKWFFELIKRDCDPNSGVYKNTGYNKDLYKKIKDITLQSIGESDMLLMLATIRPSCNCLFVSSLFFVSFTTQTYITQSEETIKQNKSINKKGKEQFTDDKVVPKAVTHPYVDLGLPSGTKANHPYVDLGLPSGTLWADRNMGATSPENVGDFYAWGELKSRERSLINSQSYMYKNTPITLRDIKGTQYDAANTFWGEPWCMPTRADIQELMDNTIYSRGIINGVNVHVFTAKNGNKLCIPGYEGGGGIWSSTRTGTCAYRGWEWGRYISFSHQYEGFPIRPVCKI